MLPGKRYTGPILDRPSPSLLLAFAMDGALDSRITFTRADSGTRFDYNGVMQTESSNVARFTHDPATYYPSSTSNSISGGRKTFAVSYQYTVGAVVQATYDASNWMRGTVIAASGSSVTIKVQKFSGSGTYASWGIIQCLGLLIEESRTNLLTYSEEFDNANWGIVGASISGNAITAPDGTSTADKIIEDTANSAHLVQQIKTLTTDPHSFSVYAKAGERVWLYIRGVLNGAISARGWFNLSSGVIGSVDSGAVIEMENAGNGWYRCTMIFSSAASGFEWQIATADADSSTGYIGDGTSGIYIWGAQLEAGSKSSSYIKTTSSTATRAADNASITGSNFSGWYNQAEGTFVIDYENGLVGYIVLAAGSDTSNVIRLGTRLTGSSDEVLVVLDGGAGQVSLGSSPSTQRNICAASYKQNDFALSMNGAAASTTSSGAVPTANTLAIGGTPFYGAFNGTIASIAYYPKALPGYLKYLTS